MGKTELAKKTRLELMGIAKERGLLGRSRMKKAELVSSLSKLLKAKGPGAKKQEKTKPEPAPPGKTEGWQEKVEDTKFYLGAEEKGFATEEELPSGYGDNKVVLMVRDPHWAYVYWEINSRKVSEARTRLRSVFDDSRLILRVYDVTGVDFNGDNANSFFDIEIPNVLGNWYVNIGTPNRTFCLDVGYRKPDGGIFVLSRSNKVTSPRDSFSDVLDEEWMTSDEEYKRIYGGTLGFRGIGSSAELAEMMKKRLEGAISSGGIRGVGLKESYTKH